MLSRQQWTIITVHIWFLGSLSISPLVSPKNTVLYLDPDKLIKGALSSVSSKIHVGKFYVSGMSFSLTHETPLCCCVTIVVKKWISWPRVSFTVNKDGCAHIVVAEVCRLVDACYIYRKCQKMTKTKHDHRIVEKNGEKKQEWEENMTENNTYKANCTYANIMSPLVTDESQRLNSLGQQPQRNKRFQRSQGVCFTGLRQFAVHKVYLEADIACINHHIDFIIFKSGYKANRKLSYD